MTESDSESSAPCLNRQQRTCRWCAWVLVAILVYFTSYGPAVLRAVNHYGQIGPKKEKFLRTIYAPATALAKHSDAYRSYRELWVRQSRNYDWWLERKRLGNQNRAGLVPPVD